MKDDFKKLYQETYEELLNNIYNAWLIPSSTDAVRKRAMEIAKKKFKENHHEKKNAQTF